jgi:hypothetical protein
MLKEKWYAGNFEYRDWDEEQPLLRTTLIITHFTTPKSKSVGVVVSEVFASKEDAEEAYPDNIVGTLEIEEKAEEGDRV